jgi:NADH dehydrogenase
MATRSVATVFGGSGFIGRYVVKRLAARGHIVRVAVCDPEGAMFLKPAGAVGQVVLLAAPVQQEEAVRRAVDGADLVVNLAGILAERRSGDFQRIHAEGAGRVARLAAAAGATRLVHMSAIGADPASPSRYGSSKAAGEQAVRAAYPSATILRPSLVFGPDDALFNRFATMARLLWVMPVICGGTRFQPVYVGDVADAVMAALTNPDAAGKLFELAGPRALSMRELLTYVLELTGRELPLIPVPLAMARMQAVLLERLPGRFKLLTRDQLRMLERDNLPTAGVPGLSALGVVATPMELIVPDYLRRYRPGGGRKLDVAAA